MNERTFPLQGEVLLANGIDFDAACDSTETYEESVRAEAPRNIGCDVDVAQVATSMSAGPNDLHYPLLDLDVAVHLVPSSTPGHSHLYVDKPMTWEKYQALLGALQEAGILEAGFVTAAKLRGHSALRLPWVKKGGAA